MASGAPAFIRRLQERRAWRRKRSAWRTALVDDRPQCLNHRGQIGSRQQGLADLVTQRIATGLLLEKFRPVVTLYCDQLGNIDENRQPITVQEVLADRRLVEAFCLKHAACDGKPENLGKRFSDCIDQDAIDTVRQLDELNAPDPKDR
jgi:hypothetical protein